MERYLENYRIWQQTLGVELADKKEIEECFYKDLEFGTGGLRGIMGIGTNRMNEYMVRKATRGLAEYLISNNAEAKKKGVVIAYDSRNHSREFAQAAALSLCERGIKVFLFRDLEPTPVLSFAVRALQTVAGIVITASHNPKEYNGYKVYNGNGCQVLPDEAEKISENISKIDNYLERETITLEDAECKGLLKWLDEKVERQFLDAILREQNPGLEKSISVVYTPLYGTGNRPVQSILKATGVNKLHIVQEQQHPNGDFPTVKVPNPEDKSALELGIHLAEKVKADLVLGTDPDCDRIGVAVRHENEYILLSGNQVGALLVKDILEQKKSKLMPGSYIVKTIVTGDLGAQIAADYGVNVKEVLTGFKYIGALMDEEFLFGYEESYGFLSGHHVRDKDAVVAALLICEMAERYKKKGMTLLDGLEQLYCRYGYYTDGLDSITLPGKEGCARIDRMMKKFRGTIYELGDQKILKVLDYQTGIEGLPSANVLKMLFEDGSWIAVRPSGTEPKLKIYYCFRGTTKEESGKKRALVAESIREVVQA